MSCKTPIRFIRKHKDAVLPSRAHPTDVGYDLVAIGKHKTLKSGVTLYDTGLVVIPPDGHYIEILPRSSISKTGYMLANSVGTIDPDYRGNLYIALLKIVPDAPELELPFCKCQLVLRKAIYADVEEIIKIRFDSKYFETFARRHGQLISRIQYITGVQFKLDSIGMLPCGIIITGGPQVAMEQARLLVEAIINPPTTCPVDNCWDCKQWESWDGGSSTDTHMYYSWHDLPLHIINQHGKEKYTRSQPREKGGFGSTGSRTK